MSNVSNKAAIVAASVLACGGGVWGADQMVSYRIEQLEARVKSLENKIDTNQTKINTVSEDVARIATGLEMITGHRFQKKGE